jgi:methylmalonyl-CoA/ethylmalonyl-CoA epimerase
VIGRLDHVAVAVRKIEERLPFYREHLGLSLAAEEIVPGEKVRVAILGEGPGRIELLEATEPGSPVEKFLRERGEGIHHLCFLVDSVRETCERLQEAGLRLAGGIRAGSEGTLVAFLHPKETGGVLIELREAGRDPAVAPGEKP